MTTPRLLERLWNERKYPQLIDLLRAGRADLDPAVATRLTGPTAAAALAVIRLDELGQSLHPFASVAIRALIASQQPDGGWGDLAVTAMALRALRCSRGTGHVVTRGMQFLAAMQKPAGAWPTEPIRRLPADPALTAFILLHLAGDGDLARLARVDEALDWLHRHRCEIAPETRPWVDRATARWRRAATVTRSAAPLFAQVSWS